MCVLVCERKIVDHVLSSWRQPESEFVSCLEKGQMTRKPCANQHSTQIFASLCQMLPQPEGTDGTGREAPEQTTPPPRPSTWISVGKSNQKGLWPQASKQGRVGVVETLIAAKIA